MTVNEVSHRKHAVDVTNPNAPSMVLYNYQKDLERPSNPLDAAVDQRETMEAGSTAPAGA